jgi:TolA-binding protein
MTVFNVVRAGFRLRAMLLLLLLVPPAIAAAPRDLFEEGERRFASGNFSLAIERFEHLLTTFPETQFTPQAQFRIAQSHFYLQNYTIALSRFQRAAARTPAGEAAQRLQFWIGLTFYHLNRHDEATVAMTRYLQDPREQAGRAYLYRGLSAIETDDALRGIADLEQAIALTAGLEQSFAAAALMDLRFSRGEDDLLLRLWSQWEDRGSSRDPYHEQRLRRAADATYRQGDSPGARGLYRQLTDFSLDSAQWGFQQLSRIAQEEGDRGAVQEIFRQAERRLAGEPQRMRDFWYTLGADAFQAQRYELAELNFFRIWELREHAPVDGAVPFFLARAVEAQNREEEAVAILEQSLTDSSVRDDHELERVLALTRLYLRAGQNNDAADLIDSRSERRDDAVVLYAWATALTRSGRENEVLPVLIESQMQPLLREEPELFRVRGRLHLGANQPGEAVRSYRSYMQERESVEEEVRLELLRALVQAEQFSAAAQEGNRIDPTVLSSQQRDDLGYLLGLTAFHGQRWSEVIQQLSPLAPERYEPMRSYHLSWAHYRLGENRLARNAISPVIDQLPREVAFPGGYLYSWTLYQERALEQSTRQLLRLLGIVSTRDEEVQARQLLATVHLENGQTEQALTQYRLLLDIAASDAERAVFWGQYAGVLAAIGRAAQAVREYDALNEALPETAVGRVALIDAGQVLFGESQFAEARERFRRYRNQYPQGRELDRALYWAGAASLEQGESGRALLWWEPLIQQFPRSVHTPRALLESARIHERRGEQRQSLELFDRFVAAYPNDPALPEAEAARRRLRLETDGLSAREATLWVELQRIGDLPGSGTQRDRWFELILELGRISIREQISVTAQAGQRGLIVDYLIAGARANHPGAAEAALLLGEYYRRRGENRAAIQQYVRIAAIPGVDPELAAQGLYELALVARQEREESVAENALQELQERFPGTVWADRAERLMNQ